MVCNTKDYLVFALCPLFGILKTTEEHNVSETGSVSILRRGGGGHLLCWSGRKK
jgi:hypothetical protein